ncbi:MAG: hypothetical protein D4R68_02570 [Ignavibacteriales bacterium]|nr:MAG: hypothetical protein D4R68_02570 [Ignavibacteriales bacterium]
MKAPTAMRVWFLVFAVIIFVGIYLTGFSNAHWFLYLPVIGMVFAAVTGICPSQIAINKMFGSKEK